MCMLTNCCGLKSCFRADAFNIQTAVYFLLHADKTLATQCAGDVWIFIFCIVMLCNR